MNNAIVNPPSIHAASVAINFATGASDVPAWIQLTPPGPGIVGVDGRSWTIDSPEELVSRFNTEGRSLPVDFEHATEIKPKTGEPAPAVGWIEELAVRSGAIWGRVAWNEAGSAAIASKAYRYISPVFWHDKANRILRMASAALTNQPNFTMTALNRAAQTEDDNMNLAAIRKALGLGEDADEGAILTAINAMRTEHQTALNNAKGSLPDAEKFVPRATYEAALNRATAAEGEIAEGEKAGRDAAIETAVNAAIKDGKVAPADKEFYVASCAAEGGLDRFKAWIEKTPQIAAPSGLDGKTPAKGGSVLSEDEIAACRATGMSEDEFITAKKAEAGKGA